MIRLREILSLTLLLVHARARTRANTEYITMNYLRPDAHFFFLFPFRIRQIVSLVHLEERPRRRIIPARMRGLQTAVDKIVDSAEPLGSFRTNRFTRHHLVKDLVCLCVFQNVLPPHTLL